MSKLQLALAPDGYTNEDVVKYVLSHSNSTAFLSLTLVLQTNFQCSCQTKGKEIETFAGRGRLLSIRLPLLLVLWCCRVAGATRKSSSAKSQKPWVEMKLEEESIPGRGRKIEEETVGGAYLTATDDCFLSDCHTHDALREGE